MPITLRITVTLAMLAACRPATSTDLGLTLHGAAERAVAFHWVPTPAEDTLRPPMPIGHTVITQRAMDHAGEPALLQVLEVPAGDWHDTLLIRQRDLLPIWEHSHARDGVILVDYDGRRVRWSMRRGDSTLAAGDSTYSTPIYAFDQAELVVRSVPFEAGRTLVVPFYSEGTPEVEQDTVTVVSAPSANDTTWTVRFADAAIYSVYHLAPGSRDVIAAEVVYRPRGTRYQRVADR